MKTKKLSKEEIDRLKSIKTKQINSQQIVKK